MKTEIKTKRLTLCPMSDAEIEALIERTPSDELRAAYGEMLSGGKSDPGKCRPGCDHFRSYRRVYRTTEGCTAVCLLQVRSLYGSGGSEKDG